MGSSFHSSYQTQKSREIGEEKSEKDQCLRSAKSKFMAGVRRNFLCDSMTLNFNLETGYASEVLYWIA